MSSVTIPTETGLLRSVGGRGVLKSMRKMRIHLKGDEGIPGAGDFLEERLDPISEQMDRRYRLRGKGYTFDRLCKRVGRLFGLNAKELVIPGNSRLVWPPEVYRATGLFMNWVPATETAKKLELSRSAVSRAVRRSGQIAPDHAWSAEA